MSHSASSSKTTPTIEDRIIAILDLMRPAIQADGGDVEFVEFTDDHIVRVRFHGACVGCPSSTMTLQSGIARRLQDRIPEVKGVSLVED